MTRKTVDQTPNSAIMSDMGDTALSQTMSVALAAKLLGLSTSIVSRYVKHGRLRGSRIPGGRSYVVDANAVQEFLAQDRRSGNPNFSKKPS